MVVWPTWSASGATPERPEVRQLVSRAIKFLESAARGDPRLGARALVGLVLVKDGFGQEHPQILQAVEAIREELARRDPAALSTDIYSASLSAIFLIGLDSREYAAEIRDLLKSLFARQKPHGAWGYSGNPAGDTSMTQHAVLALWEASQAGFDVPTESVERVAVWLLRTQDPSGAFGYHGIMSPDFTPVRQDRQTLSLTAAGLGSVSICMDLLGVASRVEESRPDLPPALREVGSGPPAQDAAGRKMKTRIAAGLFHRVQERGNAWLEENYQISPPERGAYTHYYLYALERYMTFREIAESRGGRGNRLQTDPSWYDDGVRFLSETQAENGSWRSKSNAGVVPDTAFGVLFLLRSMQKSLKRGRGFGDGMLIGGRGLPRQTAEAKVRSDGKVVAKSSLPPAEQLLRMLRRPEIRDFQQAIDLVAELPPQDAETLMRKHAEKFRRLAGDESPEARIAAVRVLGKVRDLDNVPTLIYALTDPDPQVVRQARYSLQRVSRRPAGFDMPETLTEVQHGILIEKWKAWYRAIRPDAEFEF